MIETATIQKKRGKIATPLKIIFTEEGSNYFIRQGRKIQRFRLADGSENYGILLVDYTPKTVQRMICLGYVSKVELEVENVQKKRNDIVDLVKLFTYGMLYRQLDTVVHNMVLKSELIKQWNRSNIKNPIDSRTPINTPYLQLAAQKNAKAIGEMKQQILGPLTTNIAANSELLSDEKNVRIFLAERFLENLNNLIWFVLVTYQQTTLSRPLLDSIQKKLAEYLRRADIPEYLALMLIELINNTKYRLREIDQNDGQDGRIFMIWTMTWNKKIEASRGRMQVSIFNEKSSEQNGAVKTNLTSRITKQLNLQVKEKSLKDFYSEIGKDSSDTLDLGLYYLSYLNDACKKLNVHFESFVNQRPDTKQTLIHNVLVF